MSSSMLIVQWKRHGEEHWSCKPKRGTSARCRFAGPRGSHEELIMETMGQDGVEWSYCS